MTTAEAANAPARTPHRSAPGGSVRHASTAASASPGIVARSAPSASRRSKVKNRPNRPMSALGPGGYRLAGLQPVLLEPPVERAPGQPEDLRRVAHAAVGPAERPLDEV